jgi:PAS domain S-box-containing protein
MINEEKEISLILEHVDRLFLGIESLKKNNFDVVLLNLMLPDSRGINSLLRVKVKSPEVPVIILTGLDDETIAARAVRKGAQDYLIKGKIDSRLLLRSIKYAIERNAMLLKIRKKTKELNISKANFKNLIEKNNDGVTVVSKDKKILYANSSLGLFLGCPPSQLIGKTAFFPVNVGEIADFDLPISSEEVRCAKISTVRTQWKGELAYLVTFRDITVIKQSQKVLSSFENRYKAVVEHNLSGIFRSTVDARIIDCNDSFAHMLGFNTREDVISYLIGDFYYCKEEKEIFLAILKEKRILKNYELSLKRLDGNAIKVLINAILLQEEDKQMILGMVVDITDLKQTEDNLRLTLRKLRKTMDEIILAMSRMVEKKDAYTAGHQRRVADLSCTIGKKMRISENQIESIQLASLIHDIGKIGIPAELLSKPVELTPAEFNIIKTHPIVGYEILKTIDFPWPIADIVLEHHERLNGSGYPSGLKGEEILIEARILGVADTVEAMVSHRPYRPALGIEKALEEIRHNRGILYDPAVVDASVSIFKDGEFKF